MGGKGKKKCGIETTELYCLAYKPQKPDNR